MRAIRKYYSLTVFMDERWSAQFGDYIKSVVEAEASDCYEDFEYKIICTVDNQASVDEAVRELNKK